MGTTASLCTPCLGTAAASLPPPVGEQPPFPTPQLLTHLLHALLRAGAAHLPLNPAWRWARRAPAEMGVTQVIAPIWCPSSLGPSPRARALVWAVEAAGGSARLLVSWLPAPSCSSSPPGTGVCGRWVWGTRSLVCGDARQQAGDAEGWGMWKNREKLSFLFRKQHSSQRCPQEGEGGCLQIPFLGGFGCSGTSNLSPR